MNDKPLALIAELTHRCPLRCVYCSNPLELAARKEELTTTEWISVFEQAAAIGVLHVHMTGGEPLLRPDLEELVAAAHEGGLYVNLITSGIGLNPQRILALVNAGLDHIQLSLQDAREDAANDIAGVRAYAKKIEAARLIRSTKLAFTVNVVVHRKNLDRLEEIIAFAEELGPQRIEIANVQYYGWALKNRDSLLPTREQVERSVEVVTRARERLGRASSDSFTPASSEAENGTTEKISELPRLASLARDFGCGLKRPQNASTSAAKACAYSDDRIAGLKACSTQKQDRAGAEIGSTAEAVPFPDQNQHFPEQNQNSKRRIEFVPPDYYGKFPKPCMGGWGRRLMLVDPAGRAMPCHAAVVIPNIEFDRVQERALQWIWEESAAFTMFRGEDWMQEPCRTCPRRSEDFGGCRCQAFLIAGDASAADPVCSLSPQRALINEILEDFNRAKPKATEQMYYRVNPAP